MGELTVYKMGQLLAIACAPVKRGALVPLTEAILDLEEGVAGDARGKRVGRQVTVVFRESWEAACHDLGVDLPWTTRRANLFVEGLDVPRETKRLVIGAAVLEVTQETQPCQVMEAAHRGLRAALTPDWRGGVCCRVVQGGTIRVGDRVHVE
jgi:MOSC domain-containing protein YiiM